MTDQRRPNRLRLRTRLTLAFGLGAFLLSTLLSTVTYGLTRNNLLERRETVAAETALSNAERIAPLIAEDTDEDGVRSLLTARATIADATAVLRIRSDAGLDWISANPNAFSVRDLNTPLRSRLAGDDTEPFVMRYLVGGEPTLVTMVPIGVRDGVYAEAVPLTDIEDTLQSIGLALLGAGLVTTLSGVAIGVYAARRVLSPLEDVSRIAEALARGDLSARLDVGGDADLTALAASFNEMAGNLEERIERDARFASDVSHELRSPLMTIMASAEVLGGRRDELSERSVTALDLLQSDLERFRQLVEDLLEISRYDTSGGQIEPDYFGIAEFVRRAAAEAGYPLVPVSHAEEINETVVSADKRRMGRVITNLLQNASNYGGGATGIELRQYDDVIEIAVEDSGPGVPVDERQLIFGRFARGSEGGRRGAGTGTGLGLALVAEHVRLHGGRVRVDDRPDGLPGARFVVELPVVVPT